MACNGRSAVLAVAHWCGPQRRGAGIFPGCSAVAKCGEVRIRPSLAANAHINERLPTSAVRCRSGRNEPGAIPAAWLLGVVAFSFAAVAVMMARTGMTVESPPWLGVLIGIATGVFSAICLRFAAPQSESQRIWRDAAEYFGLFMSICLIGAVAPYPLAVISSGFVDLPLERVDQVLRFDWLAWYRFVADHPAIQWFGRAAYESIYLSPAVLLGYFAWAGRKAEARLLILTFWAAASITLALYGYVPARGPLALLWRGPLPYVPASALYQADLIPALRSHALHRIDLSQLQGLVSVPSFHAASAIIFICAAWPVRLLRWPILIVNLAMLLATPVEGTHYLADIIAGVIVACAAVAGTIGITHHFGKKAQDGDCGWQGEQDARRGR